MTAPALDPIKKALQQEYGTGSMVAACAKDIQDHWEDWEKVADEDRDLPYLLHMRIWNWFAGGGTAEIAAEKVLNAVGYEQ